MKLNIQLHESLPSEYHEMAERSLRTAIDFLDSTPRPMTQPPIENFTPDWEKMQFTIGHIAPGGRFRPSTMAGFAHLIFRISGDLVLESTPTKVIMNQDLEISNTCSMVSILDGLYYSGTDSDSQLVRQLQYLDSIAGNNKSVRSLLDDYEQQQAELEQAAREAAYKQQLQQKRYLAARKRTYDEARRMPDWYVAEHESEPQCKGSYLITTGGYVTSTSEDWDM